MIYLSTDLYRALQARLADAEPSIMQPDIKSIIAEILGDFGIWPAYCRDEPEQVAA